MANLPDSPRLAPFTLGTADMRGLKISAVVIALLLAGCERYALDRKMEELCKTDGGIRVYETVVLPPQMFDENGDPFPGWRARPAAQRLGTQYALRHDTTYLKRGEPLKGEGQLMRSHWKVERVGDGRVLGEAIVYVRSGGDSIVLDHFSSKTCPQQLGAPASIIHAIFIKGQK